VPPHRERGGWTEPGRLADRAQQAGRYPSFDGRSAAEWYPGGYNRLPGRPARPGGVVGVPAAADQSPQVRIKPADHEQNRQT
jgi:hypothetical protein